MSRRVGFAGVAVLAILSVIAVLAPLIAPYHPGTTSGLPYLSPSGRHWLGTDDVGHDIFSDLLDAARISLLIAATVAVLSKAVAAVVGILAGALRGPVDAVLMRSVDAVLVVPALPLVVFISGYLGRTLLIEVVVMAFVLWAVSARLFRSQAMVTRELLYVRAARSFGASNWYVMWRHILPAVLPLAVAALVRTAGTALLLESSLDFLGLGDPSRNTWGTMLYFANARGAFISGSWLWWVVPPGMCIGLVVVATAFIGLLVEERADPRLRGSKRRGVADTVSRRLIARGGLAAWSPQPDLTPRARSTDGPAV